MKTYKELVKRAQDILAEYIADHTVFKNSEKQHEYLTRLTFLFDCPEQRAIEQREKAFEEFCKLRSQ